MKKVTEKVNQALDARQRRRCLGLVLIGLLRSESSVIVSRAPSVPSPGGDADIDEGRRRHGSPARSRRVDPRGRARRAARAWLQRLTSSQQALIVWSRNRSCSDNPKIEISAVRIFLHLPLAGRQLFKSAPKRNFGSVALAVMGLEEHGVDRMGMI